MTSPAWRKWASPASSAPARRWMTSSPFSARPQGRGMLAELLARFRRHGRLALARLLSLAARGEHLEAILAGLPAAARPARVVAITGPGGVGKSTLTGRLIEEVRGR